MIIEGAGDRQSLFVERKVEEYRSIVESVLKGNSPTENYDSETAKNTLDRSEIDCYRTQDGSEVEPKYSAIREFLQDPSTERVIQSLKTAGLLGMGGAGAPAYSKWDETRMAPGDTKYVVCNADEKIGRAHV